jgi:hypothetical protein
MIAAVPSPTWRRSPAGHTIHGEHGDATHVGDNVRLQKKLRWLMMCKVHAHQGLSDEGVPGQKHLGGNALDRQARGDRRPDGQRRPLSLNEHHHLWV